MFVYNWYFPLTVGLLRYPVSISLQLLWWSDIWSLSEVSVKKLNFAHTHTQNPAKLSYLNKYPELLCGPSCDHSQKQAITMENSPWGKKEYFRVGPAIQWIVNWMSSPGLQTLPLQLIKHLANTSIVMRHLLQVQRADNLCIFSTCWIWVLQYGLQIGAAYSS